MRAACARESIPTFGCTMGEFSASPKFGFAEIRLRRKSGTLRSHHHNNPDDIGCSMGENSASPKFGFAEIRLRRKSALLNPSSPDDIGCSMGVKSIWDRQFKARDMRARVYPNSLYRYAFIDVSLRETLSGFARQKIRLRRIF